MIIIKKMLDRAFYVMGGTFVGFLILSFWMSDIWEIINDSRIFLLVFFAGNMLGEYLRYKRKNK